MSYGQVEERAVAFGAGLSAVGMEPGQDSFVGIYSQNNISVRRGVAVWEEGYMCGSQGAGLITILLLQWVVAEQAANCYSRVVVPLYDTLGPEAVSYIINLGEHSPS